MSQSTFLTQDVSKLNEMERYRLINSIKVSKKAFKYIKYKLKNLSINIGGEHQGNIMELLKKSLLTGWCWETTESAIVFLEDDDYIERGNLNFGPEGKYWHSWICFNSGSENFVFDPCLTIFTKQSIYHHVFEVEVKGTVTAKQVQEDLIYRINEKKRKSNDFREESILEKFFVPPKKQSFWKKCLTTIFSLDSEKETHILGDDDVNSPMYRNNTGYKAIIKNGKIKKMIAYFYYDG